MWSAALPSRREKKSWKTFEKDVFETVKELFLKNLKYDLEQSAAPLDRDPSIEIEEEPVRHAKKKAVPEVVIPVQRNNTTQDRKSVV